METIMLRAREFTFCITNYFREIEASARRRKCCIKVFILIIRSAKRDSNCYDRKKCAPKHEMQINCFKTSDKEETTRTSLSHFPSASGLIDTIQ